MKTIYTLCTFFLTISISAQIFPKSSYHFVVIKNDTNHDITLVEFEQNIEKTKHTISPHSEKKCNFLKSTESIEARVKNATATYNVSNPITSNTKTITILQHQTLHIRAQ